jgi:hypothetical protein
LPAVERESPVVRIFFATVLILTMVLPTPGVAQTLGTTKNVEFSIQNQLLRGAVLSNDYKPSDFLRDYRITTDAEIPTDYLAAYSARWYGLQVEELSRADLALEGAGTGATMGMLVGALGQTLGLWDEDKTWMMVGAMSALGAAWSASKVDDPSWRYRLRWEEQNDLTVPVK